MSNGLYPPPKKKKEAKNHAGAVFFVFCFSCLFPPRHLMTIEIFNLELWEDSNPILTCQHVVNKWMATKNTQRYSFDNEATGWGI